MRENPRASCHVQMQFENQEGLMPTQRERQVYEAGELPEVLRLSPDKMAVFNSSDSTGQWRMFRIGFSSS
jgi:hypothetical protein